jgi:sortase A
VITSSPDKRKSNRFVFWLAAFGLWLLIFALGKSVVDLIVLPKTLDLTADDQLQAGFLPVYSEEDATADPDLVAVSNQLAQPFPTPQLQEVQPTAEPGLAPDRILIPIIDLDAPVDPIGAQTVKFEGELFQQWLAPSYRAAGWHNTSVGLGVAGNTVLNGHHNIYGEVFRDLVKLQTGDEIDLVSRDQEFRYVVVYTAILPERNQPLEVRLANAEWIRSTEDERLTLITCWPYESNTHRVIVVAVPIRVAANLP